ncbi:MAG: carbamoyl-phosphate synthase (glutamine-hydrolyzing) large subunit [Phycisphaeraceae bacterium]|nr:carbamoyl-phosphate synthase (glutamine-hydrolyzing) large subunit [Phycisphaerales bacterium]MCB9843848.1 carbamoyl-phosphate synthase (glutamine-hydrolyzing) large subunit [Phycisphaeraceae bacterium]
MKTLPRKVLVLGSSALKIGEAGEFDYSGSQAIKALKEEGIRTVLINPNIATIQTSEALADKVYFLPVTPEFVERVIEKEKPDGLLLSFGGQTALNCGLKLHDSGVLDKHGVRVLGTPVETIRDTEDRELFVRKLNEVNADAPRSKAATTVNDAVKFAAELGYPVMMRIAYALGGLGSGVVRDEKELRERVKMALAHAPQVLVEECLTGWKEVEYEVVRDRFDNCLTICNMENLDPLGIHTGESIVVAPSQTLSNREYHLLREVSIRVIRHLGVVGECNIQFALDPKSEQYRIIEVNARLSRSSALASKATGYPLAFVAAKLGLGYGLHELPNAVTRSTKAFFEPALDYCVVKVPRWDLRKFRKVRRQIGSAMKSVGEVMAIGRTFEEGLQKAIRMLDIGARGLVANPDFPIDEIERELREPTDNRIFAVVEALRQGYSVERIHELSHIDPWFLQKIERVVALGRLLEAKRGEGVAAIGERLLRECKRTGFSDGQICALTGATDADVRAERIAHGIRPAIRQIDTLAGEYPAKTNYLYLSYDGVEDDVALPVEKSVIVLGSGAYRIGCSVEFDWCCVNTVRSLRKLGYRTVMINYNPETVSTDYDESDLLFFDEISQETVREIYERVGAMGVVVSMGGQIPNNLALKLHRHGVRVLGTTPESIDNAEDRHKFSKLLDELDIDQPEWRELTTEDAALSFAEEVGYPVLIRPSYVLSGAAMAVAASDKELRKYLHDATLVSPEHPIVMSKFLENAKEIEYDAVARDGEIIVYAISEHVENAGVHSGDATLVFPPQRTYLETIRQIRRIATKVAQRLKINGPFNFQFIAKDNAVKVIECNLRASRSFPFVSKVLKQNFIDLATKVIMGEKVEKPPKTAFELNHVGVKAPQFSFTRLQGADPTLGVEMASTGEVACIGDDFNEAFLKALISVGYRLPVKSMLLSVGPIEAKAELLSGAKRLRDHGIKMYATEGTAKMLADEGFDVTRVAWPMVNGAPAAEGGVATAVDRIREHEVDLVINIPSNDRVDELTNGYVIRRAAVDFNVPLITNRQIAQRFIEAVTRTDAASMAMKAWDEY